MDSRLKDITAGQWNNMIAATLAFFFDSWDAYLLIYVQSEMAHDLHVSVDRMSLALVFTYASRWLGGVLLGNLSARRGRKLSLVIGILIFGLFTVLTGFVHSFPMLLAMRLGFGIGMGGLYAAAGPLVMETVPSGVRGFASGFFMFGFYVGTVLAPWTYVWFVPHIGWRGMFYVGGLSLFLIPYVWFTCKESFLWTSRQEELRLGPISEKPLSMWALVSRSYWLITLALIMVEFGVFFDAYPFQSVLPVYLKLGRHFNPHMVATAGSMIGVGALFGSVLGGRLSDRIGRKRTFALAFILAIVPTSIGVLAPSITTVAIASFVNGMIFGAMGGMLTAFENEHYPTDLRAVGNGLIHNLGAFGGSIGAAIATALHQRLGYGPAIMLITAAGACLGLSGLSFTRETKNASLLHPPTETAPL